jgi:pilus assembly protein CpaD
MQRPILIPLLLTLALAACGGPDEDLCTSEPNRTLQVDHVRVQMATAYAPGTAELPPGEAVRLQTFLDQAGVRPSEHVYVAAPSGDPMSGARIGGLAKLLSRRGLDVQTVAAPQAGLAPNHLLVMVDRYVVAQPTCPGWSDSSETPHDNTPNSNFGCANLANFALMIANPRDLTMGHPLGAPDGDQALAAVDRYRTDTVKPLLAGVDTNGQTAASTPASTPAPAPPAAAASTPAAATPAPAQ